MNCVDYRMSPVVKEYYNPSNYYLALLSLKGLVETLLIDSRDVSMGHGMRVRISKEIQNQFDCIKLDTQSETDQVLLFSFSKLNQEMCVYPEDMVEEITHRQKVDKCLIMSQILESILIPLNRGFKERATKDYDRFLKAMAERTGTKAVVYGRDKDFDQDVPF